MRFWRALLLVVPAALAFRVGYGRPGTPSPRRDVTDVLSDS